MTGLSTRSTDSPCGALTFTAKQASLGLTTERNANINIIGNDSILDAPDVYGSINHNYLKVIHTAEKVFRIP